MGGSEVKDGGGEHSLVLDLDLLRSVFNIDLAGVILSSENSLGSMRSTD